LNDFGRNIKGLTAVLKPRNYYKKPSTDKERTVVVIQGSGCNPEMAYGRNIECRTGSNTHETISSYDLEYVIDEGGKKLHHIETDSASYVVAGTIDKKPLLPPEKHLAKRKR